MLLKLSKKILTQVNTFLKFTSLTFSVLTLCRTSFSCPRKRRHRALMLYKLRNERIKNCLGSLFWTHHYYGRADSALCRYKTIDYSLNRRCFVRMLPCLFIQVTSIYGWVCIRVSWPYKHKTTRHAQLKLTDQCVLIGVGPNSPPRCLTRFRRDLVEALPDTGDE